MTLRSMVAQSMTLSAAIDRKSTRLNSSHSQISYAVFCLKKKKHHVRAVAWRPEGKVIAPGGVTGGQDSAVRLWEALPGRPLLPRPSPQPGDARAHACCEI